MSVRLCVLSVLFAIPIGLHQPVSAADIQGGMTQYDYFNSFFVRFPSTSPFYPDPARAGDPAAPPIDVEIAYNGRIKEVWQNQGGDEIEFEVVDVFGIGDLGGTPFHITGGASAPQLAPFVGTYSQLVRDPSSLGFATGDPSSLTSAFRRASGPFAQILNPGTAEEVVVYGATPYAFESTITSLPYEVGQELIGTDDSLVDLRLQLGAAPSGTDPVIGQALPNGYIRITRVVPEPVSASMFVPLGITLWCFTRRRRRESS
ncbi:MAG: hypothetical protein R3E01_36610 [Pirellulaceae bacterium]|nr:hypothetical protein [Planctomycetales bacterium]